MPVQKKPKHELATMRICATPAVHAMLRRLANEHKRELTGELEHLCREKLLAEGINPDTLIRVR